MRETRILATQTRYALLTNLRNPRAIVFAVILPIVLLVLFVSLFASGANATTRLANGTMMKTAAYYTAGLTSYAIMMQTFSALAISVATDRESGQLKRLRGTPMPPWTFIASLMLRSVLLVAAMVLTLFLVGVFAFGVSVPAAGIAGIVVYVALGTAALAALGVAITIVTPSPDVTSTLGPFGALILGFISGAFIPIQVLPGWLTWIGRVFPLYHLAEGLQRSLATGAGGTGLNAENLGVLAAWGLGGLIVAASRFRWEPQTTGV